MHLSEPGLPWLAGTALTIGTLHTLAGPDHYLPFVAMAKAKNWSLIKTVHIVIICGVGHVLGSIVLGFIGIAAGYALSGLEQLESVRGSIAAWLMLCFGLIYTLWGIYRMYKNRTHSHAYNTKRQMTFWILFTIFVFGPCEPLIPILMYPAAQQNYAVVAFISFLFALTTITTMVLIVILMLKGFSLIRFDRFEKYQHVIAGITISVCGAAILFLGL
jgi:sulfite exporter TauE/SafE